MWPWEHLAVGYLVYSLGARILGRDPPSDRAVVALGIGTQLPDLVDKPLSWGLGWFPSGYALAHSAFVAVPLGVLVLCGGWWVGHRRPAVAFVVGYWTHLLADVLNPLRNGNPILPRRVLWPVVEASPYETDMGLGRGVFYLQEFLAALSTMPPERLLLLYLLLPAALVAVWLLDGRPGSAIPRKLLEQARGLV